MQAQDSGTARQDTPRSAPAQAFDIAQAVEGALRHAQAQMGPCIVLRRMRPMRVLGSQEAIMRVLCVLLVAAAASVRSPARARVIFVDTQLLAGRVRVRVSDNGGGADATVQACLAQADAGVPPSAGAALPQWELCSAIVRAHGGRLGIAQRHPHGTRYHFDLAPAPASMPLARPAGTERWLQSIAAEVPALPEAR